MTLATDPSAESPPKSPKNYPAEKEDVANEP